MNGQPLMCVVDASVGVKLFVVEPFSDKALTLFAQLAADPPAQLYVPDLFFAECANTLWKYVYRFGYPAATAQQDIADLRALALRSVSTADLISGALEIGVAYAMTVYDACYVELARRLRVPLVTADETLVRTLARTSFTVYSLRDCPLPDLPPQP